MGLRTRMKTRVKQMLGRPQPTPSARPAAPVPPPAPTAAPAPTPQAAPPRAAAPVPAVPKPAADAPTSEEALKEAKAAHHFEKTRRAVLRFIEEQGGEAGLAEMHDYSERRYFVGHKRFSDLMEGLVAESLITYDHGSGRAALTEAGRTLGHTPMPPRPKR